MNAATFTDYALTENLSKDETYTVELLIEYVRSDFDPDYWDDWSERGDARRSPDYEPHFSKDHVSLAAKKLEDLTWLSLQRLGEQPVREITAIGFLTELTGLALTDNEIENLTPLANCSRIKRLFLKNNPIRDIAAIGNCTKIEELDISGIHADDLSALENLPELRELTISTDQVDAFRRLDRLPSLETLDIGLDTFDSFEAFPDMPELRVIRGADVNSFQGVEQFPRLENLVNLSGRFSSLEPLRQVGNLTHANILGCRVDSLEPLGKSFALRDLWISSEKPKIDLAPLRGLPALHEVMVKCGDKEVVALDKLREELTPWDIEFKSSAPRYTPSLELDVVSKETFDIYDSNKPYNIGAEDKNRGLLNSELAWLDEQFEDLFSVDFEEEEDYVIPYQWGGDRSRTIALFSQRVVEAFPRLVLGIQNILSNAKNDWIIYLQAENVRKEFVVWIYPDKIMVTEDHKKTIRKLIKPWYKPW